MTDLQNLADLERTLSSMAMPIEIVRAPISLDARPADLWGINLYPDRSRAELVEFDSMINVRPSKGNRSRGVDDAAVRQLIQTIMARLVSS